MKRDMDLIRKIMLELEASEEANYRYAMKVDGYSSDQVGFHCLLIADAGLAKAYPIPEMVVGPWVKLAHLTYAGYEFLDAAREQGRWEQAKKLAAGVGGVSMEIMKQVLANLVIKQLNL